MYILTFDVEDWFHLLDVPGARTELEWTRYPSRLEATCDLLLDELERRGQRATFFVLGWIARRHPQVVRRIHQLGHEIASHSDRHQLAYQQTPREFAEDLRRSLEALEQVTGTKVRAYRSPGFSVTARNRWVFEILAEHGIEVDCSVFPALRAHGGFPGFGCPEPAWVETNGVRIKEFPINSRTICGVPFVFSGGGYFRLFPLFLIRRWMRQSSYVMTYFHPRDIDADQPRLPGLSPWRRFRAYVGVKSGLYKLLRLLDEFPFVDLRTAVMQINWAEARVIPV